MNEWNQMAPNPQSRYNRPGEVQDEPRIYWSRSARSWITADAVEHRFHGALIRVQACYITDLASVPFFARPIIATYGSYNRAAIIHDFLYEYKGVLVGGRKLTRKESDRVFFDVMVIDGVPVWQAVIMWLAVRINPLNFWPFKKWEK